MAGCRDPPIYNSKPVSGCRFGLTTASSACVNDKVPSSGVGARGAHAER